eukprot:TRINITY_DN12003_c0_g1_i2.p3 TRINITY_DN12003_c0_g1~~TRINITY_DN12003_c0_g1_i2.p3  ORF type:complete len:147 (+),score=22.15 TRINITY_DN12003_c0_g1_i2:524-964(+)
MCSSQYYYKELGCANSLEATDDGWPKQCNQDTDCFGTYGTSGECNCYPNTMGYKFCAGMPGEKSDCINNEIEYYQRNITGCYPFEIFNKTSGDCVMQKYCNEYNPVLAKFIGSCYQNVFANQQLVAAQFVAKQYFVLVVFLLTFII